MKYTVLELVQKLLAATGGDEVNSINDTVDAADMANRLEDVFYGMVSNNLIPEHEGLLQLTAASDTDYPTQFTLPTGVTKIQSVQYDKSDTAKILYSEVDYVDKREFIERTKTRDSTATTTQTVIEATSGVSLLIRNDRMPSFYTSFDDQTIIMDSFDNTVDSTLQNSKTLVFGNTVPVFSKTDGHTPDIDDNLFSLLLNEAKSWAFVEDKQTSHPKAEQMARRQRAYYQDGRHSIGKKDYSGPDFGR